MGWGRKGPTPNQVDDALEAQRTKRQERENADAREYAERHGLTGVARRAVDDAMDRYREGWRDR